MLQNLPAQFITFEGVDGSGKSTQFKAFTAWLQEQLGAPICQTREPGGTPSAEELRRLVLEGDPQKYNATEEAMLFYTARSLHLRERILPALTQNQWVVSDRFSDSTTVYQGAAGNMNATFLAQLEAAVVGENKPWLTFVLMLPPEEGLARNDKQLDIGAEIRMESKGLAFHQKVHDGFKTLLAEDTQKPNSRMVHIDASGSIEEVQGRIQAAFLAKLATLRAA